MPVEGDWRRNGPIRCVGGRNPAGLARFMLIVMSGRHHRERRVAERAFQAGERACSRTEDDAKRGKVVAGLGHSSALKHVSMPSPERTS